MYSSSDWIYLYPSFSTTSVLILKWSSANVILASTGDKDIGEVLSFFLLLRLESKLAV